MNGGVGGDWGDELAVASIDEGASSCGGEDGVANSAHLEPLDLPVVLNPFCGGQMAKM
jgi:hypothetical protein